MSQFYYKITLKPTNTTLKCTTFMMKEMTPSLNVAHSRIAPHQDGRLGLVWDILGASYVKESMLDKALDCFTMKLQYVQEEKERGVLKKCIKGLEVACVKGGAVPSPTAVLDFGRVLRDIEDDEDVGPNEFMVKHEVEGVLRQVDDDANDQDDQDDSI
eukprot:13180824-Ditylum_brightwellii.AAC.2